MFARNSLKSVKSAAVERRACTKLSGYPNGVECDLSLVFSMFVLARKIQ